MKIESIVVVTLALAAAACAHDSTKDRLSAETELTSAQMKAQSDQSALDDKQVAEQAKAQQTPMTLDQRKDLLHHENGERNAAATADQREIEASQAKLDGVQKAIERERDDYARSVKDRLSTFDGKAVELRGKSAKLSTREKDEFDAYYKRFMTVRADAIVQYERLGAATDATYDGQKKAMDRTLDEMDMTLGKLGQRL